jgi:hypothetical protein
MDEKYIWPLAGVALGWFLTVISTVWKGREARRGRTGKLLVRLILLRGDVRTLIRVTDDYMNHAENLEDYERYRKGISDRHFLEPPENLAELRKAIDEAAADQPLLTISVLSTLNVLLKGKKASLQETSKSDELYIPVISAHKVTLKLSEKRLVQHIRQLAWLHGTTTYVRVLYMLYEKRKAQNEAFLAKFSEETFAKMRELRKPNEPASQAGRGEPERMSQCGEEVRD